MTGIKTKLEHIVAVARSGSFSKAAAELNISQPALSRSVASLELDYGVTLFDRGGKGATVTPNGRDVIFEAEKLLRNIRAFEHNSALVGRGEAGRISIGSGPLIAGVLMPVIGGEMVRRKPGAVLDVSIRSSEALLSQLLKDQIEFFFFARGQLELPDAVEETPVGKMQIRIMVRSGHPLAGVTRVTLEQVKKHPLACGTGYDEQDMTVLPAALRCDNYHILRDIVCQTDAVWLSSPLMCDEDIGLGRLVELNVTDAPEMWNDIMLYRCKGVGMTPLAQFVIDAAMAFFDGSVAGRLTESTARVV